jgi:hypothetical protein
MNGNPVAEHLSVKSPLKDTNLNSLMIPISTKIDVEVTIHTVRIPLILRTNVVPCLNVSRAVIGRTAIGPILHTRRDATPPDLISESIRISDMKQLIPGFVTQVIMGMTTTPAINLPVPLMGHSKEINNVVKTLITVHDRGIEFTPRDSAIILTAKVGAILQFRAPCAAMGFNLNAKLALGTDAVVGRKGHIERLRWPIMAAPVAAILASVANDFALNPVRIPAKVAIYPPVGSASMGQPTTFSTNHILLVNTLGAIPLKDGPFATRVMTVTTTAAGCLCYCGHSIKSS